MLATVLGKLYARTQLHGAMSREELTFLEASISKQMAILDFRKKYHR